MARNHLAGAGIAFHSDTARGQCRRFWSHRIWRRPSARSACRSRRGDWVWDCFGPARVIAQTASQADLADGGIRGGRTVGRRDRLLYDSGPLHLECGDADRHAHCSRVSSGSDGAVAIARMASIMEQRVLGSGTRDPIFRIQAVGPRAFRIAVTSARPSEAQAAVARLISRFADENIRSERDAWRQANRPELAGCRATAGRASRWCCVARMMHASSTAAAELIQTIKGMNGEAEGWAG